MRALALTLVVAAVAAVGCSSQGRSPHSQLSVVASFYPLADVATKVGAGHVTVRNLTPPGAEPHDIELSPRQVDEIQQADVVVYVGGGFQPAVSKVAARRARGSVDVLHTIGLVGNDPHFWLDPSLLQKAVSEVADALVAAAPKYAADFRANGSRVDAQLAALDASYKAGLANCARHDIVTTHAAFGYVARRYGLAQDAIEGINPDAEPSASRLATLADDIKAKHVTTVFFEELVSPKVAEALARETSAKTAVLSPLEGRSKAEIAAGKDYVAIMRDNLAALRAALDCR